MTSIPEFMTIKHRECDDVFIEAETAVSQKDWVLAENKLHEFQKELLLHLDAEENILFPEFEQATGIVSGPTQVMRMEHGQMRELLKDLENALLTKDSDKYLGLSETLMILMQQHNMKEENMLYPMAQQHIPENTTVLGSLKQHCDQ